MLDLGVDAKIVEKSGAWYSYGETRLGQGRDNSRNFLEENPELLAEIEGKILAEHGLTRDGKPLEAADDSSDDDSSKSKAKANGKSKRSRAN